MARDARNDGDWADTPCAGCGVGTVGGGGRGGSRAGAGGEGTEGGPEIAVMFAVEFFSSGAGGEGGDLGLDIWGLEAIRVRVKEGRECRGATTPWERPREVDADARGAGDDDVLLVAVDAVVVVVDDDDDDDEGEVRVRCRLWRRHFGMGCSRMRLDDLVRVLNTSDPCPRIRLQQRRVGERQRQRPRRVLQFLFFDF